MALGQFESDGSGPYLTIQVSGPFTQPVEIRCLVDTGFSGFLLVPFVQALPLGLILSGTTSVTLADGQSQAKLTCLGKAHLDGLEEVGLILLEPNSTEILLGIDFLRKFQMRLLVDPMLHHIELVRAVAAAPEPDAEQVPSTAESN